MFNPSNLDPSRQTDYLKMLKKLNDPNISEAERKLADRALYAIKEQAKFKSITKMREEMHAAAQNSDRDKVERLADRAKRVDRDWQV